MKRQIFAWGLRAAVTGLAFWAIFRNIELASLWGIVRSAQIPWLILAVLLFLVGQMGCVARWRMLVPAHPSLTWIFLTQSFFVGSFFNAFLPTTVGGDVVRSYDLIKATGQWRQPLVSVLLDRLIGMTSLLLLGLAAWAAFPTVHGDSMIQVSFALYCLLAVVTFAVLGSRRVLAVSLKPFSKIGLGTLSSHATQFQETIRAYLHRPRLLLTALGLSLILQTIATGMFVAVCFALNLPIPILFVFLVVPIVSVVSQLPISLNGWGIREGALILLLGRIGIRPEEALSLSFIAATLIVLIGLLIGGPIFLTRQRR